MFVEMADRAALIESVLADPPHVHLAATDAGVWSTSRHAYSFMAAQLPANGRSLETGLGVSTVLLSQWATHHTCIVGNQAEADALARYLEARGLMSSDLDIVVETSDTALPKLNIEPVDLYFIDGGHGFPTPIIDWYYGSQFLKPGGILMIDDVQLRQVMTLVAYLDADPRWHRIEMTRKWAAYRRGQDARLGEEWVDQPFLGKPHSTRSPVGRRAKSFAYTQAKRLRRVARRYRV